MILNIIIIIIINAFQLRAINSKSRYLGIYEYWRYRPHHRRVASVISGCLFLFRFFDRLWICVFVIDLCYSQ